MNAPEGRPSTFLTLAPTGGARGGPDVPAAAGTDRPRRARPSLCALIPTLNEAAALPALLRRLRADDPEDAADQIVVADGGSGDETRAIAAAAGCELTLSAPGRGRQLAVGARCAATELLLVLHADCLPAPGALASVRRAFRREWLVAAAMRQRIQAGGVLFRAIERSADLRCALLGLVYGDSGLCVRRDAYLAAGGFRELPLFEDLDLSRRLRRLGTVRLVARATLEVSPRRWLREGPLRCTLRNWILTLGYLAGVAPERLARHYPLHPAAEPRATPDTRR